jgi:T4 RnlA family RNA ligase
MKLHRYNTFIRESVETPNKEHYIPTYDECVEMCSGDEPAFYESKMIVEGFNVSVFNYRMAQYKDFVTPITDKPNVKAYEMRGITFVFNKDGSLFNRYILLEKFFNLNQVPESMYSVVKDYKIKYINNKEDGSIASFIRLPNGKAYGKSKMGFDNDQANGINRIYRTNPDVKKFVDWTLDNDITAVFEYCAPTNRIVLRYKNEELILLRLRDKIGKHLNIKDYLDKIGSIRIAPFEDDNTLDGLIELSKSVIDKEGWVVQFHGGHMIKIKGEWYCERHGLLTEDLYREHILIGYILDDKIDDILGQIPEEEVEAHERINKMISVVRRALTEKSNEIEKLYDVFVKMNSDRKAFAAKYLRDPNFGFVMAMAKGDQLRSLTEDEILKYYDNMTYYDAAIKRSDKYELAKVWLRDNTKRLNLAREWLKKRDPSLFFQDPEENEDDN